jgi:hypothetical protein
MALNKQRSWTASQGGHSAFGRSMHMGQTEEEVAPAPVVQPGTVNFLQVRNLGKFLFVVMADDTSTAYPVIEGPDNVILFIDESEVGKYNVYPDARGTLEEAGARLIPMEQASENARAMAIPATPVVVTDGDGKKKLGLMREGSVTSLDPQTSQGAHASKNAYAALDYVDFSTKTESAPAPTSAADAAKPAADNGVTQSEAVAVPQEIQLPPDVVREISDLKAQAAQARLMMWLAGGVAAWMLWDNYQRRTELESEEL